MIFNCQLWTLERVPSWWNSIFFSHLDFGLRIKSTLHIRLHFCRTDVFFLSFCFFSRSTWMTKAQMSPPVVNTVLLLSSGKRWLITIKGFPVILKLCCLSVKSPHETSPGGRLQYHPLLLCQPRWHRQNNQQFCGSTGPLLNPLFWSLFVCLFVLDSAPRCAVPTEAADK